VIDRVNTTGSVFLGLTVGCCQCHDHKFDPISQKEYFRFFAFLNNDDEPALDLLPPEVQKTAAEVSAALAGCEKRLGGTARVTPAALVAGEKAVKSVTSAGVPAEVRDLLDVAENGREDPERERIAAYFRRVDRVRHVAAGLAVGLAAPLAAATQGW